MSQHDTPPLWKDRLLPYVNSIVRRVPEFSSGSGWLQDRMAYCITQTYIGRLDEGGLEDFIGETPFFEEMTPSGGGELIRDLPSNDHREQFLAFLADHFRHNPHFRAHYGRFLSDNAPNEQKEEEIIFDQARAELNEALRLCDFSDATILHMRGMCPRRQLRRLIERYGVRRQSDYYAKICDLAEEASKYFADARDASHPTEHSYVSEIQMLRDLVRYGLIKSRDKMTLLSSRDDLRAWLEKAFNLLEMAEERLFVTRSRFFWKLRGELEKLQGSYEKAIIAYERSLQGIQNFAMMRQLSYLRYRWAIQLLDRNDSLRADQELRNAKSEVEVVLANRPNDERSLSLWFRIYTLLTDYSPVTARNYLQILYSRSQSLEATFGLVCMWFISAAQGAPLAFERYDRFCRETKSKAGAIPTFPYAKYWLGENWRLIPDRLVPRVSEDKGDRNLSNLMRLNGYVFKYHGPTKGELRVGDGEAPLIFQPGRKPPNEERFTELDAERRTKVSCVVYFSYDNPHAYDVMRN